MTLFVPEWLNLYAVCNEIKTEFIIRTETNEAAGIMSEEGVHQGCPLGPALFCLGLRLVHLLVRHARGDAVNPRTEGFADYALQHETWQAVLTRFNLDLSLQERISLLLARKQDFLALDQYARPVQPEHVDPQHALRAYMDDQYAVSPRAPSPLSAHSLASSRNTTPASRSTSTWESSRRACSYRTSTTGSRSSRRFSRASSSPWPPRRRNGG